MFLSFHVCICFSGSPWYTTDEATRVPWNEISEIAVENSKFLIKQISFKFQPFCPKFRFYQYSKVYILLISETEHWKPSLNSNTPEEGQRDSSDLPFECSTDYSHTVELNEMIFLKKND